MQYKRKALSVTSVGALTAAVISSVRGKLPAHAARPGEATAASAANGNGKE